MFVDVVRFSTVAMTAVLHLELVSFSGWFGMVACSQGEERIGKGEGRVGQGVNRT